MMYREASVADIPGMQVVRRAVKENALSDPSRICDADYLPYLDARGRSWVALGDSRVVGFAVADLEEGSVWALFVLPGYEGFGIGRKLHRIMMDWYFTQTERTCWLSTAFDTRAEEFYRRQGWRDAGPYSAIERKFELSRKDWWQRYGEPGPEA
ncbi:MAG: N-acetyltransferase [Chitinophagaceae bacterium]|nr:MAG: N-acetyltransferase [Chitinophagaceae bacterium]